VARHNALDVVAFEFAEAAAQILNKMPYCWFFQTHISMPLVDAREVGLKAVS